MYYVLTIPIDVPFRIPAFKFVHACARLSISSLILNQDTITHDQVVGRYLHRTFLSLMHACHLAGALSPSHNVTHASGKSDTFNAVTSPLLTTNSHSKPTHDANSLPEATRCSYNVILTSEFMLIVPRKAEKAHQISVNALGFAGLLLAKSPTDLTTLTQCSVLGLLQSLAFATDEELLQHLNTTV
jgi:hypothetical protein